MTLQDENLQAIFDTIETYDLVRRIEQFTSTDMFIKSGRPLAEGGGTQVEDFFFDSEVYFALAEDDEPSTSQKIGAGAAEVVEGGKERLKRATGGAARATKKAGGMWSDFKSGWSEERGRSKRANEKPTGRLANANPKAYWAERGKLASQLAVTREKLKNGEIDQDQARKIIGIGEDGKPLPTDINLSRLSSDESKQRQDLNNKKEPLTRQETAQLKELNGKDEVGRREKLLGKVKEGGTKSLNRSEKSQLNELNSKLTIHGQGESIGTTVDMVDYHVDQIERSGSSARRAVDPRLSEVAPPVGEWPESLGGRDVQDAANKRFEGVAKKLGSSNVNAQDIMSEVHAGNFSGTLSSEEQKKVEGGEQLVLPGFEEVMEQPKPGAGQGGADTSDRQYLKPGQQPPEGAQVITTKRGKSYYSSSQLQEYRAAQGQDADGNTVDETETEKEPEGGAVAVAEKDTETEEEISSDETETETEEETEAETETETETEEDTETETEEETSDEPKGLWQELKDTWNENWNEGKEQAEARRAEGEVKRAEEVTAFVDKLVEAEEEDKAKQRSASAKKGWKTRRDKARKEARDEFIDYAKQYGKQEAQKLLAAVKGTAGPKAQAALEGLEENLSDIKAVVGVNVDAAKKEARKADVVARRAAKKLGRRGRKALGQATNILSDAVGRGKQTVGQASDSIVAKLPKNKEEAVAVAQTLQAHALNMIDQLPSDTAVYDVIDTIADKAVQQAANAGESADDARKRLGIPRISYGTTSILGRSDKAPKTREIYGVDLAPAKYRADSLTRRLGFRKSADGYFEMDGYFFKEDIQMQLLLKELHYSLIPETTEVVDELDSYISKTEEEVRDPMEMLSLIDELLIPKYSKIVGKDSYDN